MTPAKKQERSILKQKQTPSHLQRLKFFEPSSVLLKNKIQDDGMTSSGNEAGSSDSDGDIIYCDEYTIIGKLNNVFHEAIEVISYDQNMLIPTLGLF